MQIKHEERVLTSLTAGFPAAGLTAAFARAAAATFSATTLLPSAAARLRLPFLSTSATVALLLFLLFSNHCQSPFEAHLRCMTESKLIP
jgi:hypothetical protein